MRYRRPSPQVKRRARASAGGRQARAVALPVHEDRVLLVDPLVELLEALEQALHLLDALGGQAGDVLRHGDRLGLGGGGGGPPGSGAPGPWPRGGAAPRGGGGGGGAGGGEAGGGSRAGR